MFVFWTLQTACFGVYSETGNTHAAHTVIAMICMSSSYLFFYIKMNLLSATEVMFYTACEHISLFFLPVRCWFKKLCRWCTHLAKKIWFYSYIFSFRSHLRLSSYRKFYYDKSEESATYTDLFFLVILLRFCPTHYVLRVSPSSTSLFLYHWSSTSKYLYSLFPFLSLWSSFL